MTDFQHHFLPKITTAGFPNQEYQKNPENPRHRNAGETTKTQNPCFYEINKILNMNTKYLSDQTETRVTLEELPKPDSARPSKLNYTHFTHIYEHKT